MIRIYRLVPYMIVPRSVSQDYTFDKLIKSKLDEDSIYIQDSEDMVVEKYTLVQLQDLQMEYGIAFEGFRLYPDINVDYIGVLNEWYEFKPCRYLGGTLILCRDTDITQYGTNIEAYGCSDPREAMAFIDGVKITYNGKMFKLNISSDFGLTHSVFINDKYVCTFKIAKSLEALYFVQLVQVNGNFVLTLYSVCFSDEIYNRNIVITLNTDLEPLMLWNISDILEVSTISPHFRHILG